MPETPKASMDSYTDRAKPQLQTLIEYQQKALQSSQVIKTLWTKWKNPLKLVIDPENIESAQDIAGKAGDNSPR